MDITEAKSQDKNQQNLAITILNIYLLMNHNNKNS